MRPAEAVTKRETKFSPITLDQVNLAGKITGYASLFGETDLGNDVVEKGAFSASLFRRKADGIRMLFQHDPEQPIGVWESLVEDDKGLLATGRIITSTPKGAEVLELLREGAIDGLSIGFRTVRARSDPRTGNRHILAADLWEISVVTFPMLEAARVESIKGNRGHFARTTSNHYPTIREFEKWLVQDAGLSRKDARTVIARGYSALDGMPGAATGTWKSANAGLAEKILQARDMLVS